MDIRLLAAGMLALLLVAGCGPGDDPEPPPASRATSAASGAAAAPTPTSAAPAAEPASAHAEGRIAYVSKRGEGSFDVYVMNPDGSGMMRVTSGPVSDAYPNWSPDGNRITFSRGIGDIYRINPDGSNETRLTGSEESGFSGALASPWSPDGNRILFGFGDGVIASGNLVGGDYDRSRLYVMNADGSDQTPVPFDPATEVTGGFAGLPAWSPDGNRIAFTIRRVKANGWEIGDSHIYVMDADGANVQLLTEGEGYYGNPAWSPDGSRIAFDAIYTLGVSTPIRVINADGTNERPVTDGESRDTHPTWSPDGRRIAFASLTDQFNTDIYVVNADGSGRTRLTDNPEHDRDPSWGPPTGG